MNKNVLRQIKDIQVQAERLSTSRPSLEEIYEFGNYSKQLKVFLLENVSDNTINKFTMEIPDLETALKEENEPKGVLIWVLSIFGDGGLVGYLRDRKKIEHAQETIRDIRGKYASIEFLLKNYAV